MAQQQLEVREFTIIIKSMWGKMLDVILPYQTCTIQGSPGVT